MPEIRHYKITAEVSFDLSAPVAYHEAVRLIEQQLSAALKGGGGLNRPENGKIVSLIAVRDMPSSGRPDAPQVTNQEENPALCLVNRISVHFTWK